MFGWLRRCRHKWSKWETRKGTFSRPRRLADDLFDMPSGDRIVYTRRWQERACAVCGFVEQRDLLN